MLSKFQVKKYGNIMALYTIVYWSIVGTIMGKSINGHMTRVDRLWVRLPNGQFVHSAWNNIQVLIEYLDRTIETIRFFSEEWVVQCPATSNQSDLGVEFTSPGDLEPIWFLRVGGGWRDTSADW